MKLVNSAYILLITIDSNFNLIDASHIDPLILPLNKNDIKNNPSHRHENQVLVADMTLKCGSIIAMFNYYRLMTERVRLKVQASKIYFLRRIEGVALFNKVCSSDIRKSLTNKSLFFQIESSQLRWFGHASRMPQERFPKQTCLPKQLGQDQSDELELNRSNRVNILYGIAWDFFTLAK